MGDPEIHQLLLHDPEKAFRYTFERYYAGLTVVARFYLDQADEAEDVVQQLFMNIWERQHLEKVEGSIRNYLLSAVRNACINYIQKKQVSEKRLHPLPDQDEMERAFDFLINEEEKQIFSSALQSLPEQSRKSIELVYFSGHSYKKAAVQLNLSVNTLKTHLKNGLQKLRANETIRRYFSEKK
ncbi:MAG: RNA polymerase sigma-70 factor [Bacteroidetes bacterium]|nr:RNA polymerase sigma-70 factor [Bacteroidota bacterium]